MFNFRMRKLPTLFLILLLFHNIQPMFPFEKLEVYSKAFKTHQKVQLFLKSNPSLPSYLRNQYGRASLSIMLNIAEGSGRVTSKDRRNFLINSRGSVFECAAIVELLFAELSIAEDSYQELKSVYEEISKMLFAMIRNLESK